MFPCDWRKSKFGKRSNEKFHLSLPVIMSWGLFLLPWQVSCGQGWIHSEILSNKGGAQSLPKQSISSVPPGPVSFALLQMSAANLQRQEVVRTGRLFVLLFLFSNTWRKVEHFTALFSTAYSSFSSSSFCLAEVLKPKWLVDERTKRLAWSLSFLQPC